MIKVEGAHRLHKDVDQVITMKKVTCSGDHIISKDKDVDQVITMKKVTGVSDHITHAE